MATYLVETLHNTILINTGTTGTTGRHLAKSEHRLDNAQLGGCGVQSGNGEPVVDDHSGADDGRSTVHTAGHEGNLQEGGELVLVADWGLGVDDSTLVWEGHVRACEDVVGYCLTEDFYAEDVGDAGEKEICQFWKKKKKKNAGRKVWNGMEWGE